MKNGGNTEARRHRGGILTETDFNHLLNIKLTRGGKRTPIISLSFINYIRLFLKNPQNHLSLPLESRRDMRRIETFFAVRKLPILLIAQNKLSIILFHAYDLRVGRVSIFIKACGYW